MQPIEHHPAPRGAQSRPPDSLDGGLALKGRHPSDVAEAIAQSDRTPLEMIAFLLLNRLH